MSNYHLAQYNIARMRGPLDTPIMAGFVARLEDINALADGAPGFVWRLKTEDGDSTALRPYGDDRIIVNMSVWTGLEAVRDFVYRSAHVDVMRQRREWFERIEEAYAVLWWIPAGHIPTIDEAMERLETLRARGAGAMAFTFRQPQAAPDAAQEPAPGELPDECPAV